MKTEEEDPDDGYWTVGETIAETTKNALLIRVIDRRCGQMCARTDLAFRMKPGSEWDKKREARSVLKNHLCNSQKKVGFVHLVPCKSITHVAKIELPFLL